MILPIQYLRGVAALMVVWHHAAGQVRGMSTQVPWVFGTSGVDLFFVISGFIMVVTTSGHGIGPVEFWRRRVVRIVPLYWLLTLLMVAVALVAPSLFKTLKVAPVTLLESLLFIPHFSQSFPGIVWPLLVPGWTLNFEMFFYAVFGLVLFLPPRRRLLPLVTFFLVLTAIGFAFGPFSSAAAQTYTHPMLLEFAAGAAIGAWWLAGRWRLPHSTSWLLIGAGAVLLVLRDQEPFGTSTQIVGAVLVVIGALDARFASWRSPVLQSLGDSSYSLYLTHIFTLGALRVVWGRVLTSPPTLPVTIAFMLVALVVSAAVGWLVYRWVETPLQRRLNRRQKPVVPTLAAP
ncbi:MAG TPA: acyltransferase [Caldimonas sp.]|nr:acyltransferase [Caldimonas sp.]HEX4235560.1 acyltransferase [Caldimonas sp.]